MRRGKMRAMMRLPIPLSTPFRPVLLAVAVGATALSAGAQTPAAPASPAASAASAPRVPPAPTIKRWVDSRGMVHFSDAPPPAAERPAAPVTEIPMAAPQTPGEQARAQNEMDEYRRKIAEKPDAPASAPPPVKRAKGPAPGDQSCAAQWARYNAAYACLDQYRVNKGGVRTEGFKNCPVVAQPECAPPGSQ